MLLGLVAGCATRPAHEPPPAPAAAPRTLPAPPPPMPEAGYTWQDLARHAIAANPDHAAILADARAEYFRYKSRTDLQDPRLALDYTNRDTDRYSGNLRFYIPNPFVNEHTLRTGDAARRETEAQADTLKRGIALAIYALVQETLCEERALALLAARENVLADWAAHVKERQDARVATQADALALDLQRLRLKAAIQQKRLAAQTARRSLHVLTQIPDGLLALNPAPPNWPAVLNTLADEQHLIEAACARSADLAAARAAHDKARATLDTAKARQIPWLAYAQAGYGARDSGTSSPSGDTNEWNLRLAFDIPVFAWMSAEKKMAAAAMQAATLREQGIRQRIRSETTGHLADLRQTVALLDDYRAALATVPEPVRDAMPDAETYHRLTDARLSAAEHALQTELRCALIYGHILNALGAWDP
ncbi:MAG: TolC family protein [Kiritimatiellaeota bacterium]|nr:TolC family protein [Kiritimatiellota bacterium]